MVNNKLLLYLNNILDLLSAEVFVSGEYISVFDDGGIDIFSEDLIRRKIASLKSITSDIASSYKVNCGTLNSVNIHNEIIDIYLKDGSIFVKESGIIFLEIKKDKIVIYRESVVDGKIESCVIVSGSFEIENIIDSDFNFFADFVTFPKKTNICNSEFVDYFVSDAEEKLTFLEDSFYAIENYIDNPRELIITPPAEFVSSSGYSSEKSCFVSDEFCVGVNFFDDAKLSKLNDEANIYITSSKKFYMKNIQSDFDETKKIYYMNLKKSGKGNIKCSEIDTGSSSILLNSCYSFDGGAKFDVSVVLRDTFGEIFSGKCSYSINQGVSLEIENVCKYNNADISGDYEISYNQSAGKSSELVFGFESEIKVDDYGRFYDKESNSSLRFEKLSFYINIPKKDGAFVFYKDTLLEGYPNGSNFIKYNFDSELLSSDKNSETAEVFLDGVLKKISLDQIFFSKNLANENINLYACLELEDGKKYEFYKNIKLISNVIGSLSILVDEDDSSEYEFKITNSSLITEINSKVLSEFYDITLDDILSLKSNVEVVGIEYYIYDGLNYSTADATTAKLTTEPLIYYIDKNVADNWEFRDGQDPVFYNGSAGVKYRVSRDSIDKNIFIKAIVKTTYGQDKDVIVKKNFKLIKADDSVSYFIQGYNVTETLKLEEGYSASSVDVLVDVSGLMSTFRSIRVELSGGSDWEGIPSDFISFSARMESGSGWILSDFSSEEAKNFVSVLPGSYQDFSSLKFVFKKKSKNPVSSKTAIKITLDSAFSSYLITKELQHISSIIKEEYYSMEAINKSKPNGMPFVYKVVPIKETTDAAINSILLNKRVYLDCGTDRKSNISCIVYDKNYNEISRASNESPSSVLGIPLGDYFYLVFYNDGEDFEINVRFTMDDPEIYFFSKSLRAYNYFFKKNNSEYTYIPGYTSEDGEDLNRTLFFTFLDFCKFSKKTDFVADIIFDGKVFKSNVNIGYSRGDESMDFASSSSYTKNISKIFKDYNIGGISVTNLSLLNKSSMKILIKSVTFNPYEESVATSNEELNQIISRCYRDVFNPLSYNIDVNIEINHISPKYESNNISIISY